MIASATTRRIAVLIDFENLVTGGEGCVQQLLTRAAESGTVVVRRAYADWPRFAKARQELLAAGVEMIDMPGGNGKNRADMKLVVDAIELAFARDYIDTFLIGSGDSDFLPLLAKLLELGRTVWVYAASGSASALLGAYCHHLHVFPAVVKNGQKAPSKTPPPPKAAQPSNPPAAKVKPKPKPARGPKLPQLEPTTPPALQSVLGAVYRATQRFPTDEGETRLNSLNSTLKTDLASQAVGDWRMALLGKTNRPLITLGAYLQRDGYIQLRWDAKQSEYWFRPTKRLAKLAQLASRPEEPSELPAPPQERQTLLAFGDDWTPDQPQPPVASS